MRDGYDQVQLDEFNSNDDAPTDDEMDFYFGTFNINDMFSRFDGVNILKALKPETVEKIEDAIKRRCEAA